ncbi:esterase FE4 [Cephus cinctus]|uniref:Esterase FE4 n=2 Tax=Cephus cinctus TaxID=211228 RepID=A0AAJ7FV57_CEPCN|nr:esterase FE4 [Cephus cinctus]
MKNRGIKLVVAIFGLALLAQNANGADSTTVEVTIPKGTLQGLETQTALNGVTMYSFKGVRYAAPATGTRKFSVAEEVEAWDGVYDATQHGSRCAQICVASYSYYIGSDDCLFLNVYTPNLDDQASLPVMIWFHGGDYNFGSGDSDVYGPDYIVENGVVMVSVNYRLGAVGFLNTKDAAAPGNVGLKDQVAAMRWVQDNIEYFGGDPGRVTIFGDASGAGSVQYHMISPLSAGLFAHAIAQSGTVLTTWSISYTSTADAFALGRVLGINTTDSTELVNGLLNIDSKDIARAAFGMTTTKETMAGALFVFRPSVEVDVGQDIYLPADPWQLLKTGQINDVPYVMGFNKDEAIIIATSISNAEFFNSNFDGFLPVELNLTASRDSEEISEDVTKLRNFYFGGNNITTNDVLPYIELQSDIYFTYGTAFSLKIMATYMKSPIYNYLFTYDGQLGFFKKFFRINMTSGVAHADETGYMFYPAALGITPEIGSTEEKMVYAMTRMWTDFAKYGNPTPCLSENVTTIWDEMTIDGNYLDINPDSFMDQNVFNDRVKLWASIFKNVLGDYYSYFE